MNDQTMNSAPIPPAKQLPCKRGMIKFFLLSFITCGIYAIVVMCKISGEINTIAGCYDGKKTMHFLLVTLLSIVTCGIAPLVWYHKLCNRMGDELRRRGISYGFGAGSFWLWNILGSIIVVGPFVFIHKFFKAMNLLAADYNVKG